MKTLNCFNLPNPSSHTKDLALTQPLTEMSTRKYFCGVQHGRHVRLTISKPSVSQLSRQSWILNILQLYRPSQLVTGIALLFFTSHFNRMYNEHVNILTILLPNLTRLIITFFILFSQESHTYIQIFKLPELGTRSDCEPNNMPIMCMCPKNVRNQETINEYISSLRWSYCQA
jgi:hypothetical protein